MTVALKKMLADLPADERASIEARANQLIAEEMTLLDLRKARSLTQECMAELLGIGQDSVSRLEKRSDLLLSTLRGYVAAMGGDLRLIVQFPDRPSVDVSSIMGEAKDAGATATTPRRPRRRTSTGKEEDHPSPKPTKRQSTLATGARQKKSGVRPLLEDPANTHRPRAVRTISVRRSRAEQEALDEG